MEHMLSFSVFKPKVISKFTSKYSGDIEVRQGRGYKYVSTGNLTQSGGVVADVWKPVIKKYGQKNKTWLILGLATGTVARLIPKPAQITGIEIDPIMINIGKKYFDLAKIPNLKIVNKDALDYVLKTQRIFDFVLVDLYLGDQVPDFVYTQRFLKAIKPLSHTAIFNHLFYDQDKRHKAEELVTKLKLLFKKIELMRVLTNLVIIAKHV